MVYRFLPLLFRRVFGLVAILAMLAVVVQPAAVVTAAPAESVLSVSTMLDDLAANCQLPNLCSLRGAVQWANTHGGISYVIQLNPGTYELTIPGRDEDTNAAGDLDILVSVKIIGAGAGNTIIAAKTPSGELRGIDRVIDIPNSGAAVILENLTIQNGAAASTDTVHPGGGGIYNNGTLSLVGVTLFKNVSSEHKTSGKTVNGGGIYNNGTLTLTNSVLKENTSYSGLGAGLYNAGSAVLNKSVVESNLAYYGHGGGIFNTGTLTITESTLKKNTARGDDGSRLKNGLGELIGGGFGGGLYNKNQLTIQRSTLTENTAVGGSGLSVCAAQGAGGGGAGLGGALFNDSVSAAVLTTSTFSGNSATGGAGGISGNAYQYCVTGGLGGGAGGKGGDNFQENGSPGEMGGGGGGGATAMTLEYGTDGGAGGFGGGGGGGAPYMFLDDDPTLVGDGGAGSTIASLSLQVSGNGAPGGGNMYDEATGGAGGGGAGIGGAIFNRAGTLDIQFATIINNRATGGAAGAFPAEAGKGVAAGIYSSGTTTLANSIVFDNFAIAFADCAGSSSSLATAGHNLMNTSSSCPYSAAKNDIRAVNAGVDALLKDNGGPTLTRALLSGSPAIDAADNTCTGQVDQRGLPRPHVINPSSPWSCDIGAYEVRTNQNPAVNLPSVLQTNEKDPLEFRGQNAIGISDSDSYSNDIRVWFTVNSGSLTLEEVTGLSEVTGSGTGALTLVGPVDKIQAAISHTSYSGSGPWKGLKFHAVTNSPESVNFKVTANDQGNTGVGGGIDLEFTRTISVDLVDDEPTGIELTPNTVQENQPGATVGTLTTLDPDSNPFTYTVVDAGSPFEVSGTQLRLKLGVSLDRETQPTVLVNVKSVGSTGQEIIQELQVQVLDINEVPIARDDLAILLDKLHPVTIDVLANDSDPDGGDNLSIKSFTIPQHGTIVQQGNDLVYTPGSTFQQFDSFTYTIRDSGGSEATARVDIYPGLVFLPMIIR